MAYCDDKPLGEYLFPKLLHVASPILIPNFQANQWEINPLMIQMVMRNPFLGESNPYSHLTYFLELCSTFKLLDVPDEVIYLKLFPFSLMRRAREWLDSHGPNTFTSWEGLVNEFLLHFFPPALTKSFKKQIRFFEQGEEESFYGAYSRFKDLLHECPHHNLEKWELLHSFYDGLIPSEKERLDLSSGGAFMELTVNKGFEMLEKIARNSYLWEGKKEGERRSQLEISREEELFCVHEGKPFESSFYAPNQASNDLYDDEYDLELNDDTMLKIKESSIGGKSTLFENSLFELEDFNLNENELFEHDVVYVDDDPCLDSPLIDNPLFEFKDFIVYDNGLFEDSALHDEILHEDIEESCDEDIDESCEDENVGFIWPMDELFEYEDSTLFEDVLCEEDSFELWMSSKQSEDLIIDHGVVEPLHVLGRNKNDIKHANGELRGRRPQILVTMDWSKGRRPQIILLVGFRPRLNGRKFRWDLKVD